jgi:ATP-binding cassette subfamily F protein 3
VRNISTLSGGEKMRLNLGKLLLREPDLLLLDEPNNHLDLETLAWLEEYLQKWKKAMIVISHDRDFLDRVVTNILELENRQVVVYKANYSGYVELKAKRREQEEKQFKQQQQKLDHLNAFVTRFKYKATKARDFTNGACENHTCIEETHESSLFFGETIRKGSAACGRFG